jgi:hypothetical protein
MKTIYRAVMEVVQPSGVKIRYESHDVLVQAEAEVQAGRMGGDAQVFAIDFDEASRLELRRRKV